MSHIAQYRILITDPIVQNMSLNMYVLSTLYILNDVKGRKEKYNLHYISCTGRFLGPPHGTTPAAEITNKI